MTSRNWAGVSRVAGKAVPLPALLTRISTRPKCSTAVLTRRWQSSGNDTSHATAMAVPPASSIERCTSRSLSTLRAARTMVAPTSAKARANATPSPDDAPVTIAIRPSRRNRSRIPNGASSECSNRPPHSNQQLARSSFKTRSRVAAIPLAGKLLLLTRSSAKRFETPSSGLPPTPAPSSFAQRACTSPKQHWDRLSRDYTGDGFLELI